MLCCVFTGFTDNTTALKQDENNRRDMAKEHQTSQVRFQPKRSDAARHVVTERMMKAELIVIFNCSCPVSVAFAF